MKKWDLNTWNEAYFTRLKDIAQAASDRGIIVEFTFFSVLYDDIWNGQNSPFHPSNNVQGYGSPTNRYECLRQNSVNALLFERQLAAVRRIVRELNGFDNVTYEIVNEPFWNEPGVKDSEEVAFHNSMLAAIREEEAALPNRHLVAHNFPQQMTRCPPTSTSSTNTTPPRSRGPPSPGPRPCWPTTTPAARSSRWMKPIP